MSQEENINEDLYEHYRIVADPGQTPIRLDKFLLDRLEKVSRNKIQNAIKAESILLDDKPIKASYKIRPGNVVTVVLPTAPVLGERVKGEKMDLDIRYEDEHIMIIHKPVGLVVHPGVGNWTGTLVNGLVHYFQDKNIPIKDGNQEDRPGLVHRIDKDTSGLLVIAKNDYAMTHLAKQFYDHSIERTYYALVWSEPDLTEGTIDAYIGRNPKNRMCMTVFPDEDSGKPAVTHYRLLEGMYYVSLIECRLETGRTHQIRVHLKSIGHTLFNDSRYGGDQILKGTVYSKYKQFVNNCFKIMPRQALHAKTLGLIHPVSGEKMLFDSELPADFQSVLEKWRNYVHHKMDNVNE